MNILCKIFGHKWDYSSNDKLCSTARVCVRCGREEFRINLKEEFRGN